MYAIRSYYVQDQAARENEEQDIAQLLGAGLLVPIADGILELVGLVDEVAAEIGKALGAIPRTALIATQEA